MRKISKNLKIILVDDDSDDRQIFAEALAEVVEDFQLISYTDGRQVIEHFKQEENRQNLPDIIFLDINMPIVDGLETLEILRTQMQLNTLPIVMYSTSCLEKDVTKALSSGANVYLKKPNCFVKLKEALHKVLHTHNQLENIDRETFLMSV